MIPIRSMARVLTQVVWVAGGTIIKATVKAYRESVAQQGGARGSILSRHMSPDEAARILGLPSRTGLSLRDITKAHARLRKINMASTTFNGSPYLVERIDAAETILRQELMGNMHNSVRYLTRVMALKRPYMVNGFISRVASDKLGKGNPLLPLLRVPTDVYRHRLDGCSKVSHALIYDNLIVRYAALALPHLVKCGLSRACVHIHRLLEIIVSSKEELVTLDTMMLLELLRACELLGSHLRGVPKRYLDTASTEILNAAIDKSLACVNYISDSVSITSDPLYLSSYAGVFSRMGVHPEGFTKCLIRHVKENSALSGTDSLLISLEYLMQEKCRDVKGCKEAVYMIFDRLTENNLQWNHYAKLLQYMITLNSVDMPLLQALTDDMININGNGIGMDSVCSRDLCRILGLLLQLDSEYAEIIALTFVNRYSPIQKDRRGMDIAHRDIGDCSFKELLDLLSAIIVALPSAEKRAYTWVRYILQSRVTHRIAGASAEDISSLFHLLGKVEHRLYEGILTSPSDAAWVYCCGYTNVSTALRSKLFSLDPSAAANAVICYSLTAQIRDPTVIRVVSECVYHMCSASIRMFSSSSLFTRKMLDHIIESDGNSDVILVGASENGPSSMIKAMNDPAASRFLYDPSLSSNFKYLKLGENRDGGSKAPSKPTWWKKRHKIEKKDKADDIENDNIDIVRSVEDLGPEPNERDSGDRMLKMIRSVYRALFVFHYIADLGTMKKYSAFDLDSLKVAQQFLKVYDHMTPLLSTKFSQLDSEFTIYGVDEKYDSRIRKALQTHNASHLDPRFLCTAEAHDARQNDKAGNSQLRFTDAKFRNKSVSSYKPSRSRVKLNWSHFSDANTTEPTLRPCGPTKVSNAIQANVSRCSQKVDKELHGKRDKVEHYEGFISTHFNKGFIYWPTADRDEGPTSSSTSNSTLNSSRMQREVLQAVEAPYGHSVKCEVPCGPYYIDIHCEAPTCASTPQEITVSH